MKANTAAGYDNPAVIDLSDGTEVPRWESGVAIVDTDSPRRTSVAPRKLCRKSASPVNSVGFSLLVLSGILCAVSAFSPIWVYYPKRFPVAQLPDLIITYPFRHASWRGLWAVCYKLPDLNPRVVESQWPDECVWFGERDTAWESIPQWWDAAEVLFVIGLVLLLLALGAESAFACCHCGLYRAWVPTLVASLTLTGAVMFTASLGVYGDSSFQEGELTPEPTGQEGRLEWAFHLGIGGTVGTIVSAVLFYVDAVLLLVRNRGSCR